MPIFAALGRAKAQYGQQREKSRQVHRDEAMEDADVERQLQQDAVRLYVQRGQERQQQREFQARMNEQKAAREDRYADSQERLLQQGDIARMNEDGRMGRLTEQIAVQKQIANQADDTRRYISDQGAQIRRETQDRQPKPRAIPASAIRAVQTNEGQIRVIDDAIARVTANPQSVGWKGYLPGAVLDRSKRPGFASGVEARADIADIGSLIIHDRSGAAVTVSEFPRLQPFVPSHRDDSKTVLKKLARLREKITEETTGTREAYGTDYGYTGFQEPGQAPMATPNVTGYSPYGVTPVRKRRP